MNGQTAVLGARRDRRYTTKSPLANHLRKVYHIVPARLDRLVAAWTAGEWANDDKDRLQLSELQTRRDRRG